MRADPRVRHPAEVRRHADAAGGERQSEHAARLRAAGVSGRRGAGQEPGRRGDQEGARARHAAHRRAAHQNSVVARRQHDSQHRHVSIVSSLRFKSPVYTIQLVVTPVVKPL